MVMWLDCTCIVLNRGGQLVRQSQPCPWCTWADRQPQVREEEERAYREKLKIVRQHVAADMKILGLPTPDWESGSQ